MKKSPENEAFSIKNERFSRLIDHYARKLGGATARLDLWEFLFELQSERGELADPYIAVCLRNEYIKLSKAEQKHRAYQEMFADLASSFDPNIDLRIDIATALQGLSKLQRDILSLHFYGGYSVEEIAQSKRISRQAVNSCKLRALKKIKLEISQG